MVDIVDRSRFATAGAMCDIYHIARFALHQIGEEHRIAGYAQEASTSHGASSRPPVSSTPSRMQPIRGRGRGRGRGGVERRGRAGDGGAGHGVESDNGIRTLDPSLPTLIPSHTYPSPSISHSVPPHTCTSPSLPSHTSLQEIHSLPTKITDGLNSVGNYRRNIDGTKHIIFSTFLLPFTDKIPTENCRPTFRYHLPTEYLRKITYGFRR